MADSEHSLATYVSDMLALEEHIRVPFGTQVKDKDLSGYPGAGALVQRIEALCTQHIAALKSALDELGGHELSAVKSTVSNIEGWFASAIDVIRKTKVAKALRDDYTALSLCTVSYSMLLTTANAYGNVAIANLALQHLRDYAQAVMQISDAMPAVVLQDLRAVGLEPPSTTTDQIRAAIHEAWRTGPQTTTGTIESEAALNRTISGTTYPTV